MANGDDSTWLAGMSQSSGVASTPNHHHPFARSDLSTHPIPTSLAGVTT